MTTPTIRPVSDWVLIKRDPQERVSPGGIIVRVTDPTRHYAELRWGEVLAVGPGKWSKDGTSRMSMPVKPGDRVCFSPVNTDGVGVKAPKTGDLLGRDVVLRRAHDLWAVEER